MSNRTAFVVCLAAVGAWATGAACQESTKVEVITHNNIQINGDCNIVVSVLNSSKTKVHNSLQCANRTKEEMDNESCHKEARKEYAQLYPGGILSLPLFPLISIFNSVQEKNAQQEADRLFESCWNRHGHTLNGYGTYTFENGNMYKGNWQKGAFSGHGIFTWRDGGSYDGEWKDGLKNGGGYDVYSDGSTYEGEFENGMRNGEWEMVWRDGSKYKGEWLNEERTGEGVFVPAAGREKKGTWKRGKLVQ